MTDITIPPEALEAASKIIRDCFFTSENDAENVARAACLAMLKAWPKTLWDYKREDGTRIILPLPKEGA